MLLPGKNVSVYFLFEILQCQALKTEINANQCLRASFDLKLILLHSFKEEIIPFTLWLPLFFRDLYTLLNVKYIFTFFQNQCHQFVLFHNCLLFFLMFAIYSLYLLCQFSIFILRFSSICSITILSVTNLFVVLHQVYVKLSMELIWGYVFPSL